MAADAVSDEAWMQLALDLARSAETVGEVPVGAVIVQDGQIIGTGANAPIASHDPTAHAEIQALRSAGQGVKNYRFSGSTMYVTLEPCPMCAGALVNARVARLVYGAADLRVGAAGTVFDIVRAAEVNHRLDVTTGVLESECRELLQVFFRARRD
ncbi:MAG: tRNA adenosine(34) deaminase TadA [Gammaproteobacteria bacterium]|jgi:tRNA(adenine34) deaminase|nr:tRNA adenosine(34) deaminase TadA [Chromatiales bacterium]MDP6673804.1 tRNA adenosine(34) deaminase TadA [Gammaproteobacteria bacterium]